MREVLIRGSSSQPAAGNGKHVEALHHQVVIVGGGTAGIAVASRLQREMRTADIAVIEPSAKHYYQPAWTLVGGGDFRKEDTEHSEESVIPPGVHWIQDAVTEFLPEENALVTAGGLRVTYDFLVVAPGIQLSWDR
jgi:sulfide:quinone oxidoreductase